MNQKCITRLKAQTMHFMLHNTDWLYSSISTDDCRGFWNSCTLYLSVQHTGTYANIHPIPSAARFYIFASFIKAPLTWTALIVVSRVGGLPPGRRQLSEMGEEVKIKYLEFKIDLRIL